MLTALDHQHQLILATDASRATHYYCPGCRHAVTLRKGQRVVAHFAHQPGNRCNVTTESESQQHLTGKWQLARFFLSMMRCGWNPIYQTFNNGLTCY